jgi:hypothetical protein
VPVSKEDVFSTDSIALIDKRKLMRFLTFAMKDEENAQDLGGEYGVFVGIRVNISKLHLLLIVINNLNFFRIRIKTI